MSLLGKKWHIKNKDIRVPLYRRLLENRGISDEADEQRFVYPTRELDFHDPFLMKDMTKAVERIFSAIKNKERIMIFGDYDVDGITGSAILIRILKALGAEVSCKLPSRLKDGYGLRTKFIDDFVNSNVKLIITVDNGISCADEIDYANLKNIDVIVSDHHTVPARLPNATAILHPKIPGCGYPFSELTGAGVALKLAQALAISTPKFAPKKATIVNEALVDDFFDLACMGTVADLGDLRGENRYIVKEGLKKIAETRWPGLSKLKEKAGVKGEITTETVGFQLCPRINAAGRMSDPTEALRLLITDEKNVEKYAETLDLLNRDRQNIMKELIDIAENDIENQKENPILIVCNTSFHGGIIGLIAARLCEKYNKPSIAMEVRDDIIIGSCRSIPGLNIATALTRVQEKSPKNKPVLINFGGHPAAAGFTLKAQDEKRLFTELNEVICEMMKDFEPSPLLNIDTVLGESDISFESLNIIRLLAPFGMGNPAPLFACTGLPVHEVVTVGKDKTHLKIRVRANGTIIDAIGFKLGGFEQNLRNAKKVDIVGELDENVWNGVSKIQLKIKDARISK